MTILIPTPGGGAPGGFKGWKPSSGDAGDGAQTGSTEALITVVLDKSGSMEAVRDATIAGFNQFKKEQLSEGEGALVSLSVFDWEPYQICTAAPLRDVTDLSIETYVPDGCTALYDAIGDAIVRTDALIATGSVTPERVLFAVITDGEENSSRIFGQKKVFELVRAHEQAGWTFVFLGANMDSYAASQSVGVQGTARHRDWVPSDAEMRRNMAVLSHATSRWRADKVAAVRHPGREFFSSEDEQAGGGAGV